MRTEPDRLGSIADRLAGLPGVQVHQRDPQTGRVVLTLEAGSSDEEIEGLRRIQRVPGVVSADLVYHRLPPDAESGPAHTPADFGTQRGET